MLVLPPVSGSNENVEAASSPVAVIGVGPGIGGASKKDSPPLLLPVLLLSVVYTVSLVLLESCSGVTSSDSSSFSVKLLHCSVGLRAPVPHSWVRVPYMAPIAESKPWDSAS
jgi:hypothetical protein